MTDAESPMISVADVDVAFGDVTVLDGLDLGIEAGEFVGLVGPNGAGKTTLLRVVNGVLDADAGRVRLAGDDVGDLSTKAVSRRVATVPQDTHLGFAFTAEQVVEMGRTPHRSRLDWAHDSEPVAAAMARTETDRLADRQVDDLSGGERQRVLVARALAQDAPALLLDEPTASLDINHQVGVLDLARDLAADGHAVLAAIHDLDLAARFCDRLALLHDGRIRVEGPPADVLASDDLDTAFETSTAVTPNPVTGSPNVDAIDRRDPRGATVHVVGHGRPAARALALCWAEGFDVSLGVVPEGDVAATVAASLDCPVVRTAPYSNPDPGTVDRATDLLGDADVCLRVGDAPLPVGGNEIQPSIVDLATAADGIDRHRVLDAVLDGLEREAVPAVG